MMASRLILNGFNSQDIPWRNLFKGLGTWSMESGSFAFPSILNADQYPTTAPTGTNMRAVFQMPGTFTGQMVLKWSGSAGFKIIRGSPGFTVVSGSGFVVGATTADLQVRGTDGRVVFTLNTWSTAANLTLSMLAGETFSNFSNLVLCRVADETGLDGGDAFNPDFIDSITTLAPALIRFSDLVGVNNQSGSNLSRAEYLSQTSSISYISRKYLPRVWAGTVSGTDTYSSSTLPSDSATGAWVDGETFQGQFTNANTSTTPTFTVTGKTGSKTIVNYLGAALVAGDIAANEIVTLIYNATLDKLIFNDQSNGLTAAAPVNVLVDLCNALGVGFYHNYSHLFTDAAITSIASSVLSRLDASLTYAPAFSLELWNPGYAQFHLAKAMGAVLGFTNANSQQEFGWAALRHRQMMGLVTTAWASRSSKLKRTIEFQAYGTVAGIKKYYLEGFDLGSYGYNSAPDRPIDYSDWMAYAPYYAGAITRALSASFATTDLAGLTTAADDYATGVAASMQSALDWLDNDVRAGTKGGVLGGDTISYQNTNIFPAWNTAALSYSKPIIMYENGFQCWYPTAARCTALSISTDYGDSTGKIANLVEGFKNSTRMVWLIHFHLNLFFAQSQSLYGNWYTFGSNQQWSMRPGGLYTTNYKTYDAFALYNQGKSRLRVSN